MEYYTTIKIFFWTPHNLETNNTASVSHQPEQEMSGLCALAKQGGAWHYKPNRGGGRFGATQTLRTQPLLFALAAGGEKFIDLSGVSRTGQTEQSAQQHDGRRHDIKLLL